MPHKRAKLSARLNERAKCGTDLPPTGGVPLAQESIPKSMARVLQAEGVRKSFRKKRKWPRSHDNLGDGKREREPKRRKTDSEPHKPLEIKHGESLAQYNRRVEEEMRIPVAEAMQASRSTTRRARKIDQAARAAKVKASKSNLTTSKPATSNEVTTPDAPAAPTPARKTEFDKRPPTTRLNDIVQAPPSLTRLPRGVATKRKAQSSLRPAQAEGVVSMVQKQRMEEEREKAIARYRQLRELRAAA